MCRFCVEHGEGERWYLQAGNYAHDLSSDVRRADYIVHFIERFGETRERALGMLDTADRLPAPVSRLGKSLVSRRMQSSHFGQPVPIEECGRILSLATSITVIPCICRMHTPGKRAEELCMLVTTQPVEHLLQKGFESYADGPDLDDFRTLSVPEAMKLLQECELRGLMHSIWTFQTPFTAAICNCDLESGCMAMQLTAARGLKMMWRGEWVVQLDWEQCTACGACAELCPFDAISVGSGGDVSAAAERCWGCGICRAACPQDALTLVDRRSVPGVASLW